MLRSSRFKSAHNGINESLMQAIETENQHALSVFLHPESESNRYLEIPSRCVCVCLFSRGGCDPCGHKSEEIHEIYYFRWIHSLENHKHIIVYYV